MASFFETTWFLWWLFALIVISRWYWITFFTDQPGNKNNPDTWKELYRWALLETDSGRMERAVQEAEEAILLELAARPFRPQDSD